MHFIYCIDVLEELRIVYYINRFQNRIWLNILILATFSVTSYVMVFDILYRVWYTNRLVKWNMKYSTNVSIYEWVNIFKKLHVTDCSGVHQPRVHCCHPEYQSNGSVALWFGYLSTNLHRTIIIIFYIR